jgi:hypothetical protein
MRYKTLLVGAGAEQWACASQRPALHVLASVLDHAKHPLPRA